MKVRSSRSADSVSRRSVLAGAGASIATTALPGALQASQGASKTLKIMQWTHFVPAFDDWFNNRFVVEWGARNDTRVIVDNVGMTSLKGRAASEIAKRRGHDICMFLSPPAAYEDHVIDHRPIYEECIARYGKPLDLATRSTFNPKTKKFFGFTDGFVPDPVNYRKDLWDDVGIQPRTWDAIREGGRKIRQKHGVPVGIGLARELDTNMAMRSVLAAFGASVQTEDGQPNLQSREALEALKFVKALYQETMTEEVFSWDASSNNRFMLAGRGSLTLNAISITRTGENKKIPLSEKIMLEKPAIGPAGQFGVMHLMNAYVIWEFAENIDGAQRFLVDLAGATRDAFRASAFYNFPTFPQLVPDLKALISNDPAASPTDKYSIFEDAKDWTVNVGYPGYANPAIDQIFSEWLIPRMFADAASGRMTPEEALSRYSGEVARVFDRWKEVGKV